MSRSLRIATGTVFLAATTVSATGSMACFGEPDLEVPAPLSAEMPIDYPIQLWDQDIEGETLLRVRVNEMGMVDSVAVLESSGHAAFDSAAVTGALQLRFKPARRDGRRIEVWANVPVRFSKAPPPEGEGHPDR